MEPQVKKVILSLEKRRISCSYAANRDEAMKTVVSMIPENSRVGIGGSITIQELQVEEPLKNNGCEIFWHWRAQAEELDETRRQAIMSDVYLSSSNAITLDGRLVNIDGFGNRVASMAFGPKKVLIVAGKNKIVDNVEAGLDRIKNVVCPANATRLHLDTPCGKIGKCTDCSSPQRMCNITTIIEGTPRGLEMHVLLVGEDLGF